MRYFLAVSLSFFWLFFGGCSNSASDDCPPGQIREGDRCIPDSEVDADTHTDADEVADDGDVADADDDDVADADADDDDVADADADDDDDDIADGDTDADSDEGDLYPAITFDDPLVTYSFLGFEGAEDSSVQVDPTDSGNNVAQVNRSDTAATYAGTIVSTEPDNSIPAVPFDADNTIMSVRTYSPAAGQTVRLALENQVDAGTQIFVDATTTVADTFETLTFDFASTGGNRLDLDVTYDRVVIFFNFGVDGATAGAQTFYFDDIDFIGGGGIPTPTEFVDIDFEDPTITYTLIGFAGAEDSTIVDDPADSSMSVAQVVRSATAEIYAGTTVATLPGNSAGVIPFATGATTMTVRVWSPVSGIQVRLKVEDSLDPTRSVETEDTVTVAGAFETLSFDFSAEVVGTAPIDLAYTYDKVTIFFNFGVPGATAGEQTFLFDDIAFAP